MACSGHKGYGILLLCINIFVCAHVHVVFHLIFSDRVSY